MILSATRRVYFVKLHLALFAGLEMNKTPYPQVGSPNLALYPRRTVMKC